MTTTSQIVGYLSLQQMTNVDGSAVSKVFLGVRCGPEAVRFQILGVHVVSLCDMIIVRHSEGLNDG